MLFLVDYQCRMNAFLAVEKFRLPIESYDDIARSDYRFIIKSMVTRIIDLYYGRTLEEINEHDESMTYRNTDHQIYDESDQ